MKTKLRARLAKSSMSGAAARDVSAESAERFAERAHLQVDVEVGAQSTTAFAEHADRVRFVDRDERRVVAGERGDRRGAGPDCRPC